MLQVNKKLFSGLLILILAATLRLTALDKFPPLLTQDEASIAYNAWSILQTGRDEWGSSWPLVFSAFGDAKQPVYIYLTSLIFAIFGWGSGQVRLLSALAGIVTVALFGWWVWLITKNKNWSLLASLLMATSPWAVHLSRMALESNLALTFFLAGQVMLISSHNQPKQRKKYFYFFSAAVMALSAYTYIAYRLVIPIFLLLWSAILWISSKRQKKLKNQALVPLIVLVVFSILSLPGWLQGGSTTRWQQVGLLSSDAAAALQFEWRNSCHTISYEIGIPWMRFGCVAAWNKFTLPLWLIGRSWLNHVQLDFLFFNGDHNVYRNPLLTGELYFWLAPLYLLGIYHSINKWPRYGFLVIGTAVAVIPSALTANPQAIRLSPLLPFALFLVIIGGLELQKKWGKSIQTWFTVLLVLLSLAWTVFSIPSYLVNSYSHSNTWLAYGQQVAVQTKKWTEAGYLVVIDPAVIPEPHIFLAYWNKWDPTTYQQIEKNPHTDQLGFKRPTRLGDNIMFAEVNVTSLLSENSNQEKDSYGDDFIYITNNKNSVPQRIKPVDKITSLNGVHVLANIYQVNLHLDQLQNPSDPQI